MSTNATSGNHQGIESDNAFFFELVQVTASIGIVTGADITNQRIFVGWTEPANSGATMLGADDPAVAHVIGLHYAPGASPNWRWVTKSSAAGAWVFVDTGVAVAVNKKYYFNVNSTTNSGADWTGWDVELLDAEFVSLDAETLLNLAQTNLKFLMGIETTAAANKAVSLTSGNFGVSSRRL